MNRPDDELSRSLRTLAAAAPDSGVDLVAAVERRVSVIRRRRRGATGAAAALVIVATAGAGVAITHRGGAARSTLGLGAPPTSPSASPLPVCAAPANLAGAVPPSTVVANPKGVPVAESATVQATDAAGNPIAKVAALDNTNLLLAKGVATVRAFDQGRLSFAFSGEYYSEPEAEAVSVALEGAIDAGTQWLVAGKDSGAVALAAGTQIEVAIERKDGQLHILFIGVESGRPARTPAAAPTTQGPTVAKASTPGLVEFKGVVASWTAGEILVTYPATSEKPPVDYRLVQDAGTQFNSAQGPCSMTTSLPEGTPVLVSAVPATEGRFTIVKLSY